MNRLLRGGARRGHSGRVRACAFLLAWAFVFVQALAWAHGVEHATEPEHLGDPRCEQCLAFAPLGAGFASTAPAWSPPPTAQTFPIAVPAPSPVGFRPGYLSRAPPRA
jgi:hypothetical protein